MGEHRVGGRRPDGARSARFSEVFAVGEFRMIWLATAQSAVGDQLAKVALSILVYNRTGSPLLTAATYATTYLPYLLAAPLLAPLADRFARRRVVVVSDIVRGLLCALMVVPGVPLAGLFVLVGLSGLARPPSEAARFALMPDVLSGDRYVVGGAVVQATSQITQVLGFAVGGLVVAAIGPRPALAINALTFLLAAVLFQVGLRARPAPAERSGAWLAVVGQGLRGILGDRRLRTLVLFTALTVFFIVPETLAVPYVRQQLDLDALHSGVLLAVGPLGVATGMTAVGRLVSPDHRMRIAGPLALGGLAVLVAFVAVPPFWLACALVFVSGLGVGYNTGVYQEFVTNVANAIRAQAMTLVQIGLFLSQGIGALLGGVLADVSSPSLAIAAAGAVGTIAAGVLWLTWVRIAPHLPVAEPDVAH